MGELMDFVRSASDKLGIPPEVLNGMPVVELTGDTAAMVEGHRGICSYSSTAVCIRTAVGMISVEGDGLLIHVMNRDKILIHGRIGSVSVMRDRP